VALLAQALLELLQDGHELHVVALRLLLNFHANPAGHRQPPGKKVSRLEDIVGRELVEEQHVREVAGLAGEGDVGIGGIAVIAHFDGPRRVAVEPVATVTWPGAGARMRPSGRMKRRTKSRSSRSWQTERYR